MEQRCSVQDGVSGIDFPPQKPCRIILDQEGEESERVMRGKIPLFLEFL